MEEKVFEATGSYPSWNNLDENRVVRELKFLGWVDESQFEPSKSRYGYFSTNRPLGDNKEVLVYPVSCAEDYLGYKRGKAKDYVTILNLNLHGGIPGYIKYKYANNT